MNTIKLCNRCGLEAAFGVAPYACLSCCKEASRQYRVKHPDSIKRHNKERKSKAIRGLCIKTKSCTNPVSQTSMYCEEHRSQKITLRKTGHIKNKQRKHKLGQCLLPSCSISALSHSSWCLEHWLKKAYIHKQYRFCVTYSELRKLWDSQEGKCAITGESIIPGVNATLDHIVPLSRKGQKTINNLRFISKELNKLKDDMTESEFKSTLTKYLNNPTFQQYLKN
jgi:5-methylcytosine-specific restriction endonuclease McrA